jgi:hypothetical protein
MNDTTDKKFRRPSSRQFNPDNASRALKRAAQMPKLFHTLPREGFDLAKSQVVNWLCEQPEIRQAVFEWCNHTGAIVFRDGRWHGAENGSEPPQERFQ